MNRSSGSDISAALPKKSPSGYCTITFRYTFRDGAKDAYHMEYDFIF